MSPIQTVCVFCGSSTGKGSAFQQCARDLADALTAKKLHTVYGGASIGLMGILAEEVLARNGEITGVIVSSLVRKEIAHQELSRLFVVQTMHERKQKMFDLSDAFIAMPGGFGTLDEFFEIITWTQLGIHTKPCGFLNVKGYYDPLLGFLDHAVKEGFIKSSARDAIRICDDPAELVNQLIKS